MIECFQLWQTLKYQPINLPQQVFQQVIRNNSSILVGNKTVFYMNWVQKVIDTIADLVKRNGNFYNFAEFEQKYGIEIKFICTPVS